MKDNQERIWQAIEYNPQRALTYKGETLPKLDWDGKKPSEYAFIDTDDEVEEEYESSKEEPSTSKTSKKIVTLNLDRGMNDDYKTLLKDKGLDLPSGIFNKEKNVDDAIVKVMAKIKSSEESIKERSTKKGQPFKILTNIEKNIL